MHTGFQQDVMYNHNGVEKTLEYCGIMTLRSCKDNTGNSTAELYMTGPRLAQYYMGGETEGVFANVFIASNATEKWVGGNLNVEEYFLDVYGSHQEFYDIFGYDMPVTMYEVHPNIHYLMMGHNEMGMDAARNSLRIINATQPDKNYRLSYGEEEPASAELLTVDGVTPWGDTILLDVGKGVCMCPAVSPAYAICRGVELRSETEGFEFDGYMLKATGEKIPSSITFSLYLGGKKHETYTMQVSPASSFVQNFPQYEKDAENNYTFLGHSEPWRTGYLTYASGSFTPFKTVEPNGWLYNGSMLWGAGSHGCFWIVSGMKVGLQNTPASCLAIEYLAPYGGTLGATTDMFSPNLNNVYLAIAVNGEMVWPVEGGSLTSRGNWYFAEKDIDDTASLNEQWANLSFEVAAGDSVTFLLAHADGAGQVILYPTVYYRNEE